MTQTEADELFERILEQRTPTSSPGFCLSQLVRKMRTNGICLNPYVSITEIAKEKKISSPSYLIQSWMRSNITAEYLRMWEKIYNPKFQEDACDELLHTVHTTGTRLTPSLWIRTTRAKGMMISRGKGGETTAHPEIAEMFRAWLFPEFMLELMQWYRNFIMTDIVIGGKAMKDYGYEPTGTGKSALHLLKSGLIGQKQTSYSFSSFILLGR